MASGLTLCLVNRVLTRRLDAVGGFRDRDDDDDDRGGRQDDGPSRADAADSWGGEKKFQPSSAGGGFSSRSIVVYFPSKPHNWCLPHRVALLVTITSSQVPTWFVYNAGTEAALMMAMTGPPGRNLDLQKQTLHPAGVQTAGLVSHHLTDLPGEAALGTATQKETGNRLVDLLTGMVRTELALVTEAHPKRMRRTDGAGNQLSHQRGHHAVLTATAPLARQEVTVVKDGEQDVHPHQQTLQRFQQQSDGVLIFLLAQRHPKSCLLLWRLHLSLPPMNLRQQYLRNSPSYQPYLPSQRATLLARLGHVRRF